MPIVKRSRSDVDLAAVKEQVARAMERSEEDFERDAIEDDDAWTDEDLANATTIYPAPNPEQIKALRARLGLSQERFAQRFGFKLDALRQYEQGRRKPKGAAATLLRVIEADPEAVERALAPRAAAG